MSIREVFFCAHPDDRNARHPQAVNQEVLDWRCDGKEGSIRFNGHYQVEDSTFPRKMQLLTSVRETEPSSIEKTEGGGFVSHQDVTERYAAVVEVQKREIHACTNEISEIEDEDGSPMRVCFFPTDEMTLQFRVLEEEPLTKN